MAEIEDKIYRRVALYTIFSRKGAKKAKAQQCCPNSKTVFAPSFLSLRLCVKP
jgi:hypothetical protein